MWDRINFVGRAGVGVMALSAIDVALWDLNARCLGLSVTELLGGEPRTVELYGAGGWLSFSDEELVEEALKYRDAGFTAYKMRAGADWRADVERAGLVREAIGDEMDLMVDANQAWSVETAIEAASALAGLRLGWLEEPVDFEDFEGMARVRDTASMPIAAGETVYGPPPFRAMIAAGSVDVLQPDLMRCGGISGFLEVVEAARGTGIVVCPHLFSETSYQLVPVAGAGGRVEYLPSWFDHLFAGVPDRSGGSIAPAGTPGLGIAVSGECRERWEVSRQSI
jgi:L-alanine-DL-glutamate epimerase-like enolase superfamily enzyme